MSPPSATTVLLSLLASHVLFDAAAAATCTPHLINDTFDAGCGRWFPRFHPKNANPLAHNNDANAPFELGGVAHLFMQATFPGVAYWPGALGLAHVASRDLATWVSVAPTLVPGAFGGPIGGVGQPAGNATEGYYSCSATIVDGVPRIVVPAVFFAPSFNHGCPITCADADSWHCMLTPEWTQKCAMTYAVTTPANLSDPLLAQWTEPITVVDGRVDGVQPHGPGFDDTTHAWQDPEDAAAGTWRFAGQTTVCVTVGCNNHSAGDRPTYLQLWASKAGANWSKGFDALGELFPYEPDGEPDRGIMNVPDFWRKEETRFPLDLVYFGSNAYWLGSYMRSGSGPGQTAFMPSTPQQQFGRGPGEGHGYYSELAGAFVWYGWLPGSPPPEPDVPAWDSVISVARAVTFDPGPAPSGDFNGSLSFMPVSSIASLRSELVLDSRDAWGSDGSLGGVADGECLDIELNISWTGAATVPVQFGSVGVAVLGGTQLIITSNDGGSAISMNGVPLAPANSARPRPAALALRVLVDRSVVEAFAMGGRATWATMVFSGANATALQWAPPPTQPDAPRPVFSISVWRMRTAWAPSL